MDRAFGNPSAASHTFCTWRGSLRRPQERLGRSTITTMLHVGANSMTTSAGTAKNEIARFLRGKEPGVLCIVGEWGVGKTFLWQQILGSERRVGNLGMTRYSYVSLFGLNSLDDVKSAIFENMEWLDQDATSFTQRGKSGARALAARVKKLSELPGALPWVGQVFTKARSLYFSLMQDQIVCIDDLERRSKNLELKDVLGLTSFLREQRGCKVALILNAEQLGDDRDEFDTLLEKVFEEKVVFAPTAAESAAVALEGKVNPLTSKLKGVFRSARHLQYSHHQAD
jgi:hypothetical protein